MADQGLWWKLWCAALDDPHLDNLEVADFGRYCKLGAFVKRHGVGGTVVLAPPARGLCSMLQVVDFTDLIKLFQRLPNLDVRRAERPVSCNGPGETTATVTFKNWLRYQGDYSTLRVRKHRQRETVDVTDKRRRDEKRRDVEETRREVPPLAPPRGKSPAITPAGFYRFYTAYPKHEAREAAIRSWRKLAPDADLLTKILIAIDRQRASRKWQEGIIPMPATWLNQRRWEDEVEAALPFDAKTAENIRAGQAVIDRLKGART